MASNTQSLRVNISGDASQLDKTLQGTSGRMQSFGRQMQSTGKTLTKFVSGPVAGGVAALGGLAISAANTGDELATTSDKIGVNTDMLQDLEYWAEQNGVAQDQMEKAVGRLNQRVGMATQGNEKYASALSNLGVELEDNQGNVRDTDDILAETLTTLSNMEDESRQVGLATELFGTKLTRDLLPALKEGSLTLEEAKQRMDEHGRMTEEQIDKAVEASAKWDDLKTSFSGLKDEIGAELLPLLTDSLLPMIENQFLPAAQSATDVIGGLIETFEDLPGPVQKVVGGLTGFAAVVGPGLWAGGMVVEQLGKMAGSFRGVGEASAASRGKVASFARFMSGPFGLAVGGAVAVLAQLESQQRGVRDVAETLQAELEGAEASFESLSDKVLVNKLRERELLTTVRDLGLELDTIRQAALGNEDAFSRVVEATGTQQGGARRAYEGLLSVLPDVQIGAARTRSEFADLNDFMFELEGGTQRYNESLDAQASLTEDAGEAAEGAQSKLDRMRDQTEQAEQAASDFRDTLDLLNGSTISVERAAIAWGDQIGSLDEKLKETSGTLDVNTEEGRANRGMLLDTAEAARDHVQAMIEDGASTQQATRALQTHVGELRAQAIQGGVSEEAIDSYISTLNLTPEHIKTAVEAQTAEAEAKVRSLRGWLDQLSGTTRTAVELVTHGFGGPEFGGVPTRQHGGPVGPRRKFLVGEEGPELVTFPERGRVHDAGDTRRILSGATGARGPDSARMERLLTEIRDRLHAGQREVIREWENITIYSTEPQQVAEDLAAENRNRAYLRGE